MLRLLLFCSGGGFLYGSLQGLGILTVVSPALEVLPTLAGGVLGAAFLWGLARHAQVLGKRPVFLALLLANPYSWLLPLLLFIGIGAWVQASRTSSLDAAWWGAALGAVALFFALIYGLWLASTWVFLGNPTRAALFGGLAGGVFSGLSGLLWVGPVLLADMVPWRPVVGPGQPLLVFAAPPLLAGLAFFWGWPRRAPL